MYRRATAACLTILLGVTACSSRPGSPETTAQTQDCPAGLVEGIRAWGKAGFTGTVTLLRGDRSCDVATGLRDPESTDRMDSGTVFAIGSVSKSFTAAAIIQLVDDGKLALDATAGSIVRGLSGPAARATVDQLLTHTSGIAGNAGPDHEPLSRAAAIASVSALPTTFAPGKDYGYTNAGYTLLALIVDSVTGDYRTYVAEHTLRLAGRHADAGFWDGDPAAAGPRAVGLLDGERTTEMGEFDGPHWATSGNGDLAMSTRTLATWTAALFRGEALSPTATAAIKKSRWDLGEGTTETYGWARLDDKALGAAGFAAAGGGGDTGHDVVTAYFPGSDMSIAIASSTSDVDAEQLMKAIAPALVSGIPISGPSGPKGSRPDQELVGRITGTYSVRGGRLIVTTAGGKVSIQAVGDAAVDALFNLPAAVSPADVATHERGVIQLLTGTSAAGEEERDLLATSVGHVEDVRLGGTIFTEGELHTYVTIVGARKTLEAWYALDDQGGAGGADAPTTPPTQEFGRQSGTVLISSDPTGMRKDVRVSVDAQRNLKVDNGTTVTIAKPIP
jgi:CubicO group peptidase (beta-lactamase class C family)